MQTQRNVIVIPKSVTKERIISNLNCTDFDLSKEDMEYIDSFDCNGRFLKLEWVSHHPFYPFSIEF